MVVVIKDWSAVKTHIEAFPQSLVVYKVDYVGEKVRLRVKAGILGIDNLYPAKSDEFDSAIRFLDEHDAIVVDKVRENEGLFM